MIDLYLSVKVAAGEKGDWWFPLIGQKLDVWTGWPEELLKTCPTLIESYRVNSELTGIFQAGHFSFPKESKPKVYCTSSSVYPTYVVALPKAVCVEERRIGMLCGQGTVDTPVPPALNRVLLVQITGAHRRDLWYDKLIGRKVWAEDKPWPSYCTSVISHLDQALQVPLIHSISKNGYILFDGTLTPLKLPDDELFVGGGAAFTLLYKCDCKKVTTNEQLQLPDSQSRGSGPHSGKRPDSPVQGPRISSDRPKGQVLRRSASRVHPAGCAPTAGEAGIRVPGEEGESGSSSIPPENNENGRSIESGALSTGAERVQG
jgi:hypothetical protein